MVCLALVRVCLTLMWVYLTLVYVCRTLARIFLTRIRGIDEARVWRERKSTGYPGECCASAPSSGICYVKHRQDVYGVSDTHMCVPNTHMSVSTTSVGVSNACAGVSNTRP